MKQAKKIILDDLAKQGAEKLHKLLMRDAKSKHPPKHTFAELMKKCRPKNIRLA